MNLARIDNPMLTGRPTRNLELVVIDTRKRDALENAMLTLEQTIDDLLFSEADEVRFQLNKAHSAVEKALKEMEG